MDLAMQIIHKDQTVRSYTLKDLEDFNPQSLTKQAEKMEQLFSMKLAVRKAFDLV